MPGAGEAWRTTATGIELRVRLTPGAGRDAVEGSSAHGEQTLIAARVRAVPEAGKANRALAELVADWLGVAKSRVAVTAGGKSRIKTVAVAGDGPALAAAVTARLGAADAGRGEKVRRT